MPLPLTVRGLHAAASGFETWYIYFGVIDRAAIEQCVDMRTGKIVEGWSDLPQSELVKPVPPWRRHEWHKKLLKKVRRRG